MNTNDGISMESEIMHQLHFMTLKRIIINKAYPDEFRDAAAYELGWRMATSGNGHEHKPADKEKYEKAA